MVYSFNKNYFDAIDDEFKAYWLGFLWADGYVCKRKRNKSYSYEMNLRLCDDDKAHLEKFKKSLDSTHEIKIVKYAKSSFSECSEYSKFYISNNYFGSILYEKYGIEPNRYDISKIIKEVPDYLFKHFIRGVFDGDGSFTKYVVNDKGLNRSKMNTSFGGSIHLLKEIEKHLIENKIVSEFERKIQQRHAGRDGHFRELKFGGVNQGMKILDYLYIDSKIYLDRKYEKYKSYKN